MAYFDYFLLHLNAENVISLIILKRREKDLVESKLEYVRNVSFWIDLQKKSEVWKNDANSFRATVKKSSG